MTKPNILFVIVDQWAATTADGHQSGAAAPLTPAISRLAAEGTGFGRAYCPYPVCTPARAAMFTGNMPSHTNVIRNHNKDADRVPADLPFMGEIFRDAGYETGYFGKDHSALVACRGFDETGQYLYDGPGYLACGNLWDPLFTRDALSFIERERDKPFFCSLSLINPHDICRIPKGVPREDTTVADLTDRFNWGDDYLRGGKLPGVPKNHDAPPADGMEPSNGGDPGWDEKRWRNYLGVYHLMMENVDWQIGLALDTLQRKGLAENTIVVFTSDHGEHAGAHRMTGKGSLYEESTRVPLIVRGPGIATGRHDTAHGVSGVDILPTLCDLAGLPVPGKADGDSLRPLLEGEDSPAWREAVVCETFQGRMARFGKWKYIRLETPNSVELLFDLETDPGETRSVEDAEALAAGRRFVDDYIGRMGKSIADTRKLFLG